MNIIKLIFELNIVQNEHSGRIDKITNNE